MDKIAIMSMLFKRSDTKDLIRWQSEIQLLQFLEQKNFE